MMVLKYHVQKLMHVAIRDDALGKTFIYLATPAIMYLVTWAR